MRASTCVCMCMHMLGCGFLCMHVCVTSVVNFGCHPQEPSTLLFETGYFTGHEAHQLG